MNNPNSSLMSEMTQEAAKRRTGRLHIQKRDGAELNLFYDAGLLVHAQFGWTFGLAAVQEALYWQNYTISFTEGVAAPIKSMGAEDRAKLEQGLVVEQTKYSVPVKLDGYFYAEKSTTTELSDFEARVLANANGTSFDDLMALTEFNLTTLEGLIKQLMTKKLLTVEKSPATPERLKSLRLRKKEPKAKGLLGMFGKKPVELTDLEFQVYDVLNGAVTLWDVHLNLGLAREQVWEAYVSLKKRDLVENLN
ncbi:MAG: hypothetical protein RLZZ156_2850 [Deinococcota bacterium]|jgi:hypothetical protein